MRLLQDWQDRVDGELLEVACEPFAWGVMDCALFTARILDAGYGTNYYEEFSHSYPSALGAARMVAPAGGLAAFISESLGVPAQRVGSHGQPGECEPVMVDSYADNAGRVWEGAIAVAINGRALVKATSGVFEIPFTNCRYFWSMKNARRHRRTRRTSRLHRH